MSRRIDGTQPINLGQMRDLIVVTRNVVSGQNAYGEDVFTTEEVFRFHGYVRAMSGAEMQRLEQRLAASRFVIETHYINLAIDTTWIAVWGDRQLNILDAEDPDGMRKKTRMYAREVI